MKGSILIAVGAFVAYKVFKARSWAGLGYFAGGRILTDETGTGEISGGFVSYEDLIELVKEVYPELSEIPTGLVMAIIKVESNFNPSAVGAAGEVGLMQIKPQTASWVLNKWGRDPGLNLYEPVANIETGMRVLFTYRAALERSQGAAGWIEAIQTYNIGVGAYVNGKRANSYLAKVMLAWVA